MAHDEAPTTESDIRRSVTSLLTAPSPPFPMDRADPQTVAQYVMAGMSQERTPGNVAVVHHPGRLYRVPRGLFEALESHGFSLEMVPTQADRLVSISGIIDALQRMAQQEAPLDILCIAGDGTLDHHVLVAAYAAFRPDLVQYRPGEIDVSRLEPGLFRTLPPSVMRQWGQRPELTAIEPDEETIKRIWAMMIRVDKLARRGASAERIARAAGSHVGDPLLHVAVLATMFPEHVLLRPHGYDLGGLASATAEDAFRGLYPHVRSIALYPGGTAADNALFAGIPGWIYGRLSGVLTRWAALDPIRRALERRVTDRFVEYFTKTGVVVPARFSLVSMDGAWQVVCSHAVGGPGSGHMFAVDLEGKSRGLLGYLSLLPKLIIQEGMFGSTVVRAGIHRADGRQVARVHAQLAEGFYTNRTFIGGLGAIPSSDATSFAGRSTFLVAPPIVGRSSDGQLTISLRGLFTVLEAATAGILARALHLVGWDPGRLATGGRLRSPYPDHQFNLAEGEKVSLSFHDRDGHPRIVPTEVSGDPFMAREMDIRVAWGPLPILATPTSLMAECARRALTRLRTRHALELGTETLNMIEFYVYAIGRRWEDGLSQESGLFRPPSTLRLQLRYIQHKLIAQWEALDTGPFVDTSAPGIQLGRRGLYAHNHDQTAHLILIRERAGSLLVRQVRAAPDGSLYEAYAWYRAMGTAFVIRNCQLRCWTDNEAPRILREEQYFRTAEGFQQQAPAFFPFLPRSPADKTLGDLKTEEVGLDLSD